MALLDVFLKYVKEQELFDQEDKILLAVSGGVDSMVMMNIFARSEFKFGVAHCNFQLRGEESDEDEQLVELEAKRLGVAHYNIRFDTNAEIERSGESMEMVARRLRYGWFKEICESDGYTVIAVAHHIDDSIETFFINLMRGTGLKGLTGIHTQRNRIVRPMMFATRKEILEFAVSQHIPFREDSSNRSTKHLRNKIRLGLIPRMREINPGFPTRMSKNLGRLMDAQIFISQSIELLRDGVIEYSGDIHTLDPDKIPQTLPSGFVIYELLSTGYEFKGDVVDRLCDALEAGATGKRFYSRTHVAYADRGRIVVAPISDSDTCAVEVEQGSLRAFCGNSRLNIEMRDIDDISTFSQPDSVALLDADKLVWPLQLRRWSDGDWFVPFGMSGKRKVSDFLIDRKVSMAEKQRQFVLTSGDDIVWVVGHRIDDRYSLGTKSENVLKITKEII